MTKLQIAIKRSALAAAVFAVTTGVLGSSSIANGQAATASTTTASDATPSGMVRLAGHVSQRAERRFDVGEASGSLPLNGLEVVFARTADQQRDLKKLIEAQQDSRSPQYHRWLTPAQFGSRFGASDATVAAVTHWLQNNGFSTDALPASRGQLRFHGTKEQVEAAFHIRIHAFDANGVQHFAAISDPAVPASLAPAITAIRGLHDFYPRSALKSRAAVSRASNPQVTYNGGQNNYVGPGDFAVIYNLAPLYKVNGNGSGVTIAIAAESDIDLSVASTFWGGLGLSTPAFNSIPVPGGQDPGQTNDPNETEAYLDVEVAGGLAQGASILLVRDKDVANAFEYVIQDNLAAVLNISFSNCESDLGAANGVIEGLFQQAVAQGMTITVSTGDAGAALCSTNVGVQGDLSTTGYAVSGLASTPYALAVGGTDFDPTQPQDWGSTNASGTLVNAQAHIPEMVWNDTCANPLFAVALHTTTSSLCNTTTLNGQPNSLLEVAGTGGGLSSCLTLSNSVCQGGYAAPSWQTGVYGLANFRTRAVPDVSMIAANWIICSYDDSPCDPSTENVDVVGGTSAAAPSVAAIIAILDEGMSTASSPDGRQGLINPRLYSLAAAEYGSPQTANSGAGSCSASLGSSIGSGCIFYNVVAGTNAMPCKVSTYNPASSSPASTCTAASGEPNGIMSLDSKPQYSASTGFNLASGLGSFNAANLILAIYLPPPSGLAATTAGQSIKLSWTAESHASGYAVFQGAQSGQEGATPVQSGISTASATVTGLQSGTTYYFTVAAQSVIGTSAQSTEVKATTVAAAPTGLTAAAGNGSVTLTWSASTGATSYNVYQGTSSGTEAAAPVATGVTTATANITGLANGTAYYYTVAAVDAGGISAKSNQAEATPAAPPSGGGGALGDVELMGLGCLLMVRMHFASRRRRIPNIAH